MRWVQKSCHAGESGERALRLPIRRQSFVLLMLICWLAAALFVVVPSHSRAAVDLLEFTAATQADGSILLRWVTGTELDTSTFRIYRAVTPTGPWDTIVNEQDSRSDGESDTVYEFIDTNVAVGTTYYYMLEEVEVPSVGGINRYMDFIRSATAGQPGAATSTPTATRTRTPTATPGASPTPSHTPPPTATATATAAAPDPPTDVPTATRQFTNTPLPQSQPSATPTPPLPSATGSTPTPTPLPPAALATPTGPAGAAPPPAPPPATRPPQAAAPTAGAPPAAPAAPPAVAPAAPTGQTPTVTPTPVIFASQATGQPVLRSTATRARAAETDADGAPAADHRVLALGGGAVILAALLAGVALFVWRKRAP